ncbi:hypothetical protein L7F22_028837 [Adiantum nelumboides]|nr:hypothetical protein [Adiantum nelumboides]
MKKRGYTPDEVTYNSLIDGLLKAKEISKPLVILTEMNKRGCTPNKFTYNSLIDALLKAKEVSKALAVLTEMKKRDAPQTWSPTAA